MGCNQVNIITTSPLMNPSIRRAAVRCLCSPQIGNNAIMSFTGAWEFVIASAVVVSGLHGYVQACGKP